MADGAKVSDFAQTPSAQAERWHKEFAAAKESLKEWHTDAERAVKRYLDNRDSTSKDDRRLNLYSANIQTKMATLYGQTPKVSVSRRFGDANDDEGRVAGEMLERILNSGIEKEDDTYSQALHYALEDILVPGFGLCRVRYVAKFEESAPQPPIVDETTSATLAPEVPSVQTKTYECAETDYVHWKDVLWSPAKVWHEVRWVAFKSLLSREGLIERFGEEVGKRVPLTHNKPDDAEKGKADPWGRAEVWEIWDKESRKVVWFVDGYHDVLDAKDDILGLEGFWPCPRPVIPLATTTAMVPRAEFELARDLYNTIDTLQRRIDLLSEAVRVSGIYDKTAGDEVGRLLKEAGFNNLIPSAHWPALAEKGGLAGVIDWFPTEQIAKAIVLLQQAQDRAIEQLYQVTGMADIMRGASDPAETARAQGIKAKFGSVRLQRLQDEFARFASDIQRLKAEIISKHFDPQTIIAASNIENTPDAQLAPRAVELIKSRFASYRVEVKPEAISLTDFAALKQERTEVIAALGQYFTAASPLAQQMPGSLPFLLQIGQWLVAGLRGASSIEGVFDQAIAAAQQMAQQPQQQQEDPKLAAEKMKLQGQQMKAAADLQREDAKLRADLTKIQAEVQADAVREQNQRSENVREHIQKQVATNALKPPAPARPGGAT